MQALHDLEMAHCNISIGGYDIAAFLSHQAVEKLVKGLITHKGRKIPKSHYIDELGHSLIFQTKFSSMFSIFNPIINYPVILISAILSLARTMTRTSGRTSTECTKDI